MKVAVEAAQQKPAAHQEGPAGQRLAGSDVGKLLSRLAVHAPDDAADGRQEIMVAGRQGRRPPADRKARALAKGACPPRRSSTTGRCRWRASGGRRPGGAPTRSGRPAAVARRGPDWRPGKNRVGRRRRRHRRSFPRSPAARRWARRVPLRRWPPGAAPACPPGRGDTASCGRRRSPSPCR